MSRGECHSCAILFCNSLFSLFRLQRNIQSKDALIKDLKAKIETLEEAAAQVAEHKPQQGAAFGSSAPSLVDQSGLTVDIGSLSLFELRAK